MTRINWFVAAATFLFLSGLGSSLLAADADKKAPAKETGSGLPDLAGALKTAPGCLGVETAETGSGKQVIFAWFADKKSLLKWYHSDLHQEMMKRILPDYKSGRKPLADVPDGSGPIMVVASVTLRERPTKENPLPFKQIAIEIYQPLGNGLSIGGRFAPEKVKVPAQPRE